MTDKEAVGALAVTGAAELFLVRLTSGPARPVDVAIAALGWIVLMVAALAWERGRPLVVLLPVVAIGAAVALPPALTVLGPAGAGLIGTALAALLLVAGVVVRAPAPFVTAVGAMVAVGAAALPGQGVPPWPVLLMWAALVAASALYAWRLQPGVVLLAGVATALVPRVFLPRADTRPDVVVVTVDALRADVGEALPTFQGVASRGRTYEAWAPSPWTLPSLASLWTGLPADRHGAGKRGDHFVAPTAGLARLPALLRDAGYHTIAITGGSPFTGQRYDLLAGFDETWHPWEPVPAPLPRMRAPFAAARPLMARVLDVPAPRSDADALVDMARARMAWSDGPRLLWLHLMDVHLPWTDPPCRPEVLGAPGTRAALQDDPWWTTEPGRACLRAGHEAAATRVDRALARLLADLDRDHTVVVLTSDHGEALGDAGVEHGHNLSPEVLRIPLAIASPEGRPPEVPGPVSLTDVGATVLALAHVRAELPGLDLTTAKRAGPTVVGNMLYGPERSAVIDGPWELFEENGRTRLERWRVDRPGGADDLPAVVARMTKWLPGEAVEGVEVEEDEGALRAMGYVE